MSAGHERRGRGKAQASLDIVDAAVRILREIQPASVRAVCYRLFTEKLIPNMSKGSTDKISKLLVWAREECLLKWGWIVDETREAEKTPSWSNPEEVIHQAVLQYRKDYWQVQPRRVEVWSEKGTVRGTLAPVLKKYGVTFRVMHGYGSATALHSIADETRDSDKPMSVLYVGDWDPSGMHMSLLDLPERLKRYDGIASIDRVALDDSDVEDDTELPYFEAETKSKDPRHAWFIKYFGNRCWELDALSPVVLRERVEDRIVELLDVDKWNHAVKIEAAERESMTTVLDSWSKSLQALKYSEGGEA